MAHLPDSITGTALAHLFTRRGLAPDVSWFSLPGGQTLFDAGEQADRLFFVRTGRLAAIRREEGQEARFLGVIRPGEPAGEPPAGEPPGALPSTLGPAALSAVKPDAGFAIDKQISPLTSGGARSRARYHCADQLSGQIGANRTALSPK